MNEVQLEILGLVAGGIVLSSTVPPFIKALKKGAVGEWGEIKSRGLQSAGNSLWLIFGVLTTNWSLSVMTGLSATMCAFVVARNAPVWWRNK